MSRKRQRGGQLIGPLEHKVWDYFAKPFDLQESNRQAAATNQAFYHNVAKPYIDHGKPISTVLGSLHSPAVGAFAGAAHDFLKAATAAEPAAREVLRDIGPATRALGYRNLRGTPSQKAIQSIKNKSASQRKSKRSKAVRSTTLRNKHAKKATHKRGKENAAYVAKHQGKAPRSAQFYRDNGLPVPPNARS